MECYFYKFADTLNKETVQELIDRLSQHQFVTLYFSSPGGDVEAKNMLRDYLNSRKDEIFIVFDFILFSCGLLLLNEIKNEYTFSDTFECALMHKIDVSTYNFRHEEGREQRLRQVKRSNDQLLGISNITEKQKKKFSKGKDVYLYKKDLKRMGLWKVQKNILLKEIKKFKQMIIDMNNIEGDIIKQ